MTGPEQPEDSPAAGEPPRSGAAAGFPLLRWLDAPHPERGIRFAARDDAWEFHSYERLAAGARRHAAQLHAAGVRPGAVVVLVHANSPEFVAAFFGALMLGATPSPVAPPVRFQSTVQYRDHLARILRLAGARVVSTTARLAGHVAQTSGDGVTVVIAGEPEERAPEWPGDPVAPAIGLLQLSSGTTGPSRGVRVPLTALETNIDTILSWTQGRTDEGAVASWAPLYHDMGLIGCLLAPVSRNADIWLMEPEQFVRAPGRWLRCFGESGATHTAAPTFGLRHVLRRVRRSALDGMDFSKWRALIVGAERVDAAVIREFAQFLEPLGFSGQAVMPAYGLAEATLAVTGSRPDEDVTELSVRPESLIPGSAVGIGREGTRQMTLVGCGRPFPGTGVAVVDGAGHRLAEGHLGEIELTGPSVAHGYISAEECDEHLLNGVVRTGDAGFLLHGELFVVGRIGDSIKVRGRWLFAEELDDVLSALELRKGRSVALLGSIDGSDAVVVLREGGTPEEFQEIGAAVAKYASGVRVLVFAVQRGGILRTTSGKPRRRAMWERLLTDASGAGPAWDSAATGSPGPDGGHGGDPDGGPRVAGRTT